TLQQQMAETVRLVAPGLETLQQQMAETSRLVAPGLETFHQQMAETVRLVAPGLETFQQQIAETFRQQTAETLRSIRDALELINPPNWPEDIDWSDIWDVVAGTGWSLTYVPRSAVVKEIVTSDPDHREQVLLACAEDISADCRACLREVTVPQLAHLVRAVEQALDAFDRDLPIPAQATVASVLADVISRTFGLTFAAAAKALAGDPSEKPLPHFRFWLIASTIPRALGRFRCETGDEVPDRFNRHAAAHTVDPRQYTTLNALVGLMLVTGLVRQIAYDLDDAARGGVKAGDTTAG
ncbi:MAG TPA: hypothetical protein VK988_01755, partial [Acidimicrobiales bacterium]|nr:hypothetical protein [Acidimicrobiales bacterium]